MKTNATKRAQPGRAALPGTAAAAAGAGAPFATPAARAPAVAPRAQRALDFDGLEPAHPPTARARVQEPRGRNAATANPLTIFRATGVTPWDKATRYECDAVSVVGQFQLLTVPQLGEWVHARLATPAARHRQAQALTLRLCPAARTGSVSRRLATAGHRPLVRPFGRRLIGNAYHYYLNAAGHSLLEDTTGLKLPDASKALATADDMAKRSLAFERLLALYRANQDLDFQGPAALSPGWMSKRELAPVERAILQCLCNLRGAWRRDAIVSVIYVADRPGSRHGVNVAHYRELARAAMHLLGLSLRVEVVGRRLPSEAACPLTETQLAKAVNVDASKVSFRSKDGAYQTAKLLAYFGSLKPYATHIRSVMHAVYHA